MCSKKWAKPVRPGSVSFLEPVRHGDVVRGDPGVSRGTATTRQPVVEDGLDDGVGKRRAVRLGRHQCLRGARVMLMSRLMISPYADSTTRKLGENLDHAIEHPSPVLGAASGRGHGT